MEKKTKILHSLLECLAKDEDAPRELVSIYKTILQTLSSSELCVTTKFTCKQIRQLLEAKEGIKVANFEDTQKAFKKELILQRDENLEESKKEIFKSLMASNFKEKASFLEKSVGEFERNLVPVELKMYTIIKTYIGALLEALDIYVSFDVRREASVEQLSSYAMSVHEPLVEEIFYDEERTLIEDGLKQISVVYIGLYYQNLYM